MVASIQKEKAELFLKFHQDKEILVLLNSWDNGFILYFVRFATRKII
jgi:hypothetical protein